MNRLTRILAATVLAATSLAATAAPVTYAFDTVHSRVTFYVNHFGYSNSVGEFKLGDGTLSFDADSWSNSQVAVTIPAQSLDLGDEKWNAHVQSADFLDVAKSPEIHFVSRRLEKLADNSGRLYGDLTIKGVTRPVVLELRLNGAGEHPMRKTPAVGFTATTTVKRSDFGVAAYLPAVGDELEVRIEIEAFVPKA